MKNSKVLKKVIIRRNFFLAKYADIVHLHPPPLPFPFPHEKMREINYMIVKN